MTLARTSVLALLFGLTPVALAQDADRRARLRPRIAAGLRAVGGDLSPAAGLQAYLRNAAGAAP